MNDATALRGSELKNKDAATARLEMERNTAWSVSGHCKRLAAAGDSTDADDDDDTEVDDDDAVGAAGAGAEAAAGVDEDEDAVATAAVAVVVVVVVAAAAVNEAANVNVINLIDEKKASLLKLLTSTRCLWNRINCDALNKHV